MKKVIIYEEEKIKRIVILLDSLNVNGIENFRSLSEIANIIDSGTRGDYKEQGKGEEENVMESKTIQPD